MKTRTPKIIGASVFLVATYFAAYFAGVSTGPRDLLTYLILLLSGSGLLFWPVSALFWRGRTAAMRWVFLAQLAFNLVLAGFALLSNVNPQQSFWFIRSVCLNFLLFAPLAICAAIYDFVKSTPSEWRDTLHRLRDEYSKTLADPNLSASRRAELESLVKGLRRL